MDYEYEIIEKSIAYDGFFTMELYRLRHRLYSGGWSPVIRRECLERGHAVAVLPYDPIHDQVVMVEQFRVGAMDFLGGPWLIEIVAGMIGADESKDEVAHRETLEEAGCELLDLVHICDFLVSPGGTSESIGLYCGRVDASGAGGVHGLDEEHEDIRVQVYSREEVLDMLHGGRVCAASPIIALQWLEANHEKLRTRWK